MQSGTCQDTIYQDRKYQVLAETPDGRSRFP